MIYGKRSDCRGNIPKFEDLVKSYLLKALELVHGNTRACARLTGIPYVTLHRWLVKYEIRGHADALRSLHRGEPLKAPSSPAIERSEIDLDILSRDTQVLPRGR